MRYAELHCASAFSFLEGASEPEDLVERAAELELGAVALVDRNGLSGAPRFWKAATAAGITPLVGAEVVLDDDPNPNSRLEGWVDRRGPLGLVPDPPPPGTPLPRLTLLAADRRGYRNLCRLLTAAARGRPKGEARASWDRDRRARPRPALPHRRRRGGGCAAPRAPRPGGGAARAGAPPPTSSMAACTWRSSATTCASEEHRNSALLDLARRLRLPLVATGGVRYARRRGQGARRCSHLHPRGHDARHRGPPARRRARAPPARTPPRWPPCSPTCRGPWPPLASSPSELDFTLDRPGLPLPRLPPAARRDAGLVPAPGHLERRPRPLPAPHRPRPGPDRARARADREARTSPATSSSSGTSSASASARASSPRAAARPPTAPSATPSPSPPSIR